MINDEKTGKDKTQSTSAPGGKDYYPSIDELMSADCEGIERLTGKLTKEWIVCLLKDAVSHLKEKSAHLIFWILSMTNLLS